MPATSIGRYRVIRPLGHGGMAEVFLAHDPSLERDVALKLLHRDPRRQGLRDEAKTLAALRDPGIVTIYEIGEHDGRDFIAMEYIAGGTLREVMPHATRERLVAICARVAAALAVAHKARILHRDVKPENVIVGDKGEVKVVDFGIARRLERADKPVRAPTARELADAFVHATIPFGTPGDTLVDGSTTQTALGTPAYMAPEVLRGEASTVASDVYGLGVLMYECIAKQRPYEGPSIVAIITEVVEGKPPERLDDPLGALIERMLSREPDKRPSLAEVVAALAPAVRRRPRWPLALAALLVAGGGGALYLRTRRPPTVAIGVAPIEVDYPSGGGEPYATDATAAAFAIVLEQAGGGRIAATAGTTGDMTVHARVREDHDRLHGELEVDGAHQTFDGDDLAEVLGAMALAVAKRVDDHASLSVSPERAQELFHAGKELLDSGRFGEVRPYLDFAVAADPRCFDCWYGLVKVREWASVPEPVLKLTLDSALAAADDTPRRDIIKGITAFLDGDVVHAREIFMRLQRDTPADAALRGDVDYFYAETAWHDGEHDAAYKIFSHLVETKPRLYSVAAVHAFQYAVARRDAVRAGYYIGVLKQNDAWADLAAGNYDKVATTKPYPFNLWALSVLDKPLPPDIAKALDKDDLPTAIHRLSRSLDQPLDVIWKRYVNDKADFGELESLGEVLLCAGRIDDAKRVIAFLARQPQRVVRGYQRLSILAGAASGDASLVVRDGLTSRNARLADAADAELAGDHAKAADLLAALVADPTATWDYPERAALIRNLAALGRSTAEVCADTMRPAIYRPAFMAMRRLCAK